MRTFALLLPHAPDRYTSLSDDENMEIIKDYIAWVERLQANGTYVGGYKLTDDGAKSLIAEKEGPRVYDGPFAEVPEILGGIMVIKARDWDDAVEIAKTNPHMVHNRRIEIREVHAV
ncbi:MAG: YciI family protein [Pseudomonadota bacterium]